MQRIWLQPGANYSEDRFRSNRRNLRYRSRPRHDGGDEARRTVGMSPDILDDVIGREFALRVAPRPEALREVASVRARGGEAVGEHVRGAVTSATASRA